MDDHEGLIDVVRRRRSVRRFEPGQAVGRGTLLRILEAGRRAPSGASSRPCLCSLGAAIQNIQLAATAVGLTSAWRLGPWRDAYLGAGR